MMLDSCRTSTNRDSRAAAQDRSREASDNGIDGVQVGSLRKTKTNKLTVEDLDGDNRSQAGYNPRESMPDFGDLAARGSGMRESFNRPMNMHDLDDGRQSVASIRPNQQNRAGTFV